MKANMVYSAKGTLKLSLLCSFCTFFFLMEHHFFNGTPLDIKQQSYALRAHMMLYSDVVSYAASPKHMWCSLVFSFFGRINVITFFGDRLLQNEFSS